MTVLLRGSNLMVAGHWISPSIPMVFILISSAFPAAFRASCTMATVPPQQGTYMRATVTERISWRRKISASFST